MKTILIIWWNSLFWKELINSLLNNWYFVISTYNKTKSQIKSENFKQYKLNLLSKPSIDLCLNKIFNKYNIDIFIFNSSIRKFWLLIDMNMEELDLMYKTNIYSLLYIYKKYLFKYFKDNKDWLLLNIWSLCSILSFPFSQTYCSSKAFQRSMIHGFDMELSKYCIWFKNIVFWPLKYNWEVLINRSMVDDNKILLSEFRNELELFKKDYSKKIKWNDIKKIITDILSIIKQKSINKTDIIIWEDTKNLLKNNNILYSNNF